MANDEHLAKLKEGVEAWNQWRIDHPEVKRPDLSGASLGSADLRSANLRNVTLYGANLSNANLSNANLSGADLHETNLFRAILNMALLSETNLTSANLHGADLSDADLIRANLRWINLHNAYLARADLRGADLIRADLLNADLDGANLGEADLSGADLSGATLGETDLSEADLNGTALTRANLLKTNLRGTNLSHAHLYETIFIDTDLKAVKGLEHCQHHGPSTLDHRTLQQSGPLPLPLAFLRGCGLPNTLIDYLPSLLNQPIQYYSCFISYSHADKAFAQRIYDALQGKGIRCWFDEHDIPPGSDIHEEIDFGIRIWDKTLLCCSKSSLTSSWWVDNEIETAFAKERQIMKERSEKVLALIPLDLDGYLFSDDFKSGKKQQLHRRKAVDFHNWKHDHDKFEQQLDKVIRALQLDGGRKPLPEPKL